MTRPDGSLQKDPVPPLNRHQFGGALGGALVIPGLYDGHNRTFFFADYAGIKETPRRHDASTPCRPRRRASATSATIATATAISSPSTIR